MRSEPFDFSSGETVPTTDKGVFVDLSELLQEETKTSSSTAEVKDEKKSEETETATPAEEAKREEDKKEPSATIEDEVDKQVTKLLEDPEGLANILITGGNIGRIMLLPNAYESLMFPANERNDIRDIVRRAAENEKQNKEPTDGFNNYEKRLYAKWPKLQESISNISYTDAEMKTLSRLLARRLKNMTISEKLEKYDIFLYLAVYELKHGMNIGTSRANDFISKKFNFDA